MKPQVCDEEDLESHHSSCAAEIGGKGSDYLWVDFKGQKASSLWVIREKIENHIVDGLSLRQVQYLQPVQPSQATEGVATIYEQIRRDFQLVPPLTLFSPAPELLAGVWSVVCESQIAEGCVPRGIKEAVAAAVSSINTCPYCVDAHVGFLKATPENAIANTLFEGKAANIVGKKTGKIVSWALATRSPDDPLLQTPPFSPEEAPEIIGTALSYHFINRLVTIFLSASPMPIPSKFLWVRKMATKVFGATLAKDIVKKCPEAGKSLVLIPRAELSDDLLWARENYNVAAAFRGFGALMEKAGEDSLPQAVRERLLQCLDKWRGEDMGLGRGWLEEIVADLTEGDKPIARLVLLTAFAPYQVDSNIIDGFRKRSSSDAVLLAATSWASYAAVKHISCWLLSESRE